MMKTCLVIPVWNVPRREHELGAFWDMNDCLIVDDGSTNGCASDFEKLGARVVRHDKRKGLSAALRTGVAMAFGNGYDAVVTMDGDGQHLPCHLPAFKRELSQGSDFVSGNRLQSGNRMPREKLAANRLASAVFRTLYSQAPSDVLCGFRAYSQRFLEAYYLENDATGYEMISDTMLYALRGSWKMSSVDVEPIYDPDEPLVTKYSEVRSFLSVIERNRFPLNCSRQIAALFELKNGQSSLLNFNTGGYLVTNDVGLGGFIVKAV